MQGLLFARILTLRPPAHTQSPQSSVIWMAVAEVAGSASQTHVHLKETVWWLEWIVPKERAESFAQRMKRGMFCAFRGEIRASKKGPCLCINGYLPGSIQILGYRTKFIMLSVFALDALESGRRIQYDIANHHLAQGHMTNIELERLGYAPASASHLEEEARGTSH